MERKQRGTTHLKLKGSRKNQLKKIETGIPGFEAITYGGLPPGRTTLLSGTSGSGKTIFACQFLIEGIIKFNQAGVFVTFEEKPENISKNFSTLDWNIDKHEKNGKWQFVDATPNLHEEKKIIGNFDLKALLLRIINAIKKIKAKRVVLDSIGTLFNQFEDPTIIRREIYKIGEALNKLNVVTILTSERVDEFGAISRFGVEEFVSDNVIILRNVLEKEKRRRSIEILKYRGSEHSKGEHAFTINGQFGIKIIPITRLELRQKSSNERISSGNDQLDKMCGGGFYRDSIILVSGATGTGKTLLVTEFIQGAKISKEKTLLLAFEESREQLSRNAKGWGVDFEKLEKSGSLHIEAIYPETASLEDHFLNIQNLIEEYKPNRFILDSLSAIERGSTKKSFREFIIALTSYLKQREITGLFTVTTSNLMGGSTVTDGHISTITDSIILLRYAEMYGDLHRIITVLKMRGSRHDKELYEFTIDSSGMKIGNPFRHVSGILSGKPINSQASEMTKINEVLQSDKVGKGKRK